jgi:hypothetical protein
MGANYGQFNFDQFWTQQLSAKNQGQFDGSSVADLLLGYPTGNGSHVDNNAAFYRTGPIMPASSRTTGKWLLS